MGEVRAPQLVLASASRYRRRMLQAAGLSFQVSPAELDEPAIRSSLQARGETSAARIAEALARAKAEAVSAARPEVFVIGSDQVLALEGEILGKPGSLAAAREQLLRLRGKPHQLHTAVCLARAASTVWSHVEDATLLMRAFTPAFLEDYLRTAGEDICGIVGAYEIEGRGVQLFERVSGDTFSIIGLPLLPLLAELRARGVIRS